MANAINSNTNINTTGVALPEEYEGFELINTTNTLAQETLAHSANVESVRKRLFTLVHGEKPLSKSVAEFFGFKSKLSLVELGLKQDVMGCFNQMIEHLPAEEGSHPSSYQDEIAELDAATEKAIRTHQQIIPKDLSKKTQKLLEKMHNKLDLKSHETYASPLCNILPYFGTQTNAQKEKIEASFRPRERSAPAVASISAPTPPSRPMTSTNFPPRATYSYAPAPVAAATSYESPSEGYASGESENPTRGWTRERNPNTGEMEVYDAEGRRVDVDAYFGNETTRKTTRVYLGGGEAADGSQS